MRLIGGAAVVTGASRGIGRAIALALAEHGADVAVNYAHAREAADEVVRRIEALGRRAIAVRADVRDLESVRRMAAETGEALGDVDVLVNNAGILRDALLTFMKDEDWSDVIDVNLKGAFHCIKVFGRDMARRRRGAIVNIASDAGLMGDAMRAGYAAAKAGLVGLTKTAAREFAAGGITVNAVSPGVIDTGMIAGLPEARREKYLAATPLGRLGMPGDVAGAVVFLASEGARYITGQVLCVDGGLNMRG
jgi:3-oxoacyl-[acyl-carrier protein] reductase